MRSTSCMKNGPAALGTARTAAATTCSGCGSAAASATGARAAAAADRWSRAFRRRNRSTAVMKSDANDMCSWKSVAPPASSSGA